MRQPTVARPRPRVLRAAIRAVGVIVALSACHSRVGGPAAVGGSAPVGTIVVSNMNDATATLIDAASGRVVATLPTGEGPHEVAASHDGTLAVVTNYGVRGRPGNSITVIDVARAAVARTLDLGTFQRPHGVTFLPGDSLLLVTSEARQAILTVDVRSGAVVATRGTHGRTSHMLALAPGAGRLAVSNIVDGTISVLSTTSPDSAVVIPAAGAVEGIAIAPDGRHAWVGSNRDSLVVVVDLAARHAVDSLRGFGMPYRLAFSADGRTVVVSDPVRGEVRAFDAASRRARWTLVVPSDSIVATTEVPGSPSPEGVAIAPDGRWLFVTLQGRNRLATIDLSRGTIVRLTPTGTWSDGVAFSRVVAHR